jgi:hypothetical protein
MMPPDAEAELKQLDRRMVQVAIIDAPGSIALGLGLFAKFGERPAQLHPLLANADVAAGLLVIGGVITAWSALQIISIARRRRELQGRPAGKP